MKPPYQITNEILALIASISEKIGEINATHLQKAPATLRKSNRIKTIQSSLEIEGNTLSVEQITDIINNKRVLAPQKDILEVKNAIALYDDLNQFNPRALNSFLQAHKILMHGLIDAPGKIRTKAVGIVKGSKITHVAPPGEMVKALLNDLFAYLKNGKDLVLIKSCVFHYEIEFIHPFIDGNGRMGRFWQTLILKEQYPLFEYLPIETVVKRRQIDYYKALSISDKSGHSTPFIEFMLAVIEESLEELLTSQNTSVTSVDRISLFKQKIKDAPFTRKDYLRENKDISSATASRDLKEAIEKKLLNKTGDKRVTVYNFL
ncbi:Fic family protein [Chitinophaga sp. 22321]|uniref:Fic family protein n=1 Tax=Chitinophaga hostae TaxID=2831022 RepID=A0ABS5IUR6_9BACT|nr:Fic family protein [Chitinophaga hostae]MBS0026705.1 Fic family protein [Chitinophaga hostae]